MLSANLHRWFTVSLPILVLLASAGGRVCQGASDTPTPGDSFDAAPFAVRVEQEAGKSYGVCWGEPRKIRRVEAEFEPGAALPAAETLRVQYWHHGWNGARTRSRPRPAWRRPVGMSSTIGPTVHGRTPTPASKSPATAAAARSRPAARRSSRTSANPASPIARP